MSGTDNPSPRGTYASMSAQGMQRLVHDMGEAATTLTSDLSLIRARVRSTHVPTHALAQIDEIASWVEIQIPYLERRRNLASGLTADQPATAFVDVPEPQPTGLATPEGAEAYGRRLANDLIAAIDLHTSDGVLAENFVHEFLDNFELYLDDPDVMAGFFIELGPERLENLPTIILPEMINQWTHDSVQIARFTELLSLGLAQALNTHDGYSSTADYYSELAELRHHFQQPTDDPRVAWSRLALLQYGDFNSTFVADVIHGSVLNHLRDATSGELAPVGTDSFAIGLYTSYTSGLPAALELPGNVFELAFNMLAADPLAARRALHREDSATVDEYIGAMHLAEEAAEQVPPAVHNAFARALAAGAGALDNPPDNGQQAANFAFATILGLSQYELRSEVMAHAMAEPLDMVAAAYA